MYTIEFISLIIIQNISENVYISLDFVSTNKC